MQVTITRLDVIHDFKNLIDDYCEQYHLTHGINRQEICQIMVDEFADNFSDGFIRKCIDKKYKVAYRTRNAELKGETRQNRLKRKISEFESELLGLTHESIIYAKKGGLNG